MKPLPFAWPYAVVFWGLFIWAFAPEFGIIRRAERDQTASDSRSLQVIVIGQSIASFGAFAVAWMPAMQSPHRYAMFFAGTPLNAGVAVALGSWVSVVLATAGSLAVYGYRIAVEERTLLATVGEPYRQFMTSRKWLIPFIY